MPLMCVLGRIVTNLFLRNIEVRLHQEAQMGNPGDRNIQSPSPLHLPEEATSKPKLFFIATSGLRFQEDRQAAMSL